MWGGGGVISLHLLTLFLSSTVSTIESLVQHSQKAHDAQLQAVPKISQGESVISAGPVPRPRPPPSLPSEIATQLYYCHYCGVNCNSRKQWEGHCSSDKHMFNVDSDKDHQWNHRQPPWAVPQGNYQLCYWCVHIEIFACPKGRFSGNCLSKRQAAQVLAKSLPVLQEINPIGLFCQIFLSGVSLV